MQIKLHFQPPVGDVWRMTYNCPYLVSASKWTTPLSVSPPVCMRLGAPMVRAHERVLVKTVSVDGHHGPVRPVVSGPVVTGTTTKSTTSCVERSSSQEYWRCVNHINSDRLTVANDRMQWLWFPVARSLLVRLRMPHYARTRAPSLTYRRATHACWMSGTCDLLRGIERTEIRGHNK